MTQAIASKIREGKEMIVEALRNSGMIKRKEVQAPVQVIGKCDGCGNVGPLQKVTDEMGQMYEINPEMAKSSTDGKFDVCAPCAKKIYLEDGKRA
jgi:hypothetical protein